MTLAYQKHNSQNNKYISGITALEWPSSGHNGREKMREKRWEQWQWRFWRWAEEILSQKDADSIVVKATNSHGGFKHQARILILCEIIPQPSLPTPVAPMGGEGEGGERWGKNINHKSVSGLTWIYNNPGKHLLHIPGTYRKSPAPSTLIICCHRLALLSGDLFDLKSLFSKMFPSGSP